MFFVGGPFLRGDFSLEGCGTLPKNKRPSRSYPVKETHVDSLVAIFCGTHRQTQILLLYYKDCIIKS